MKKIVTILIILIINLFHVFADRNVTANRVELQSRTTKELPTSIVKEFEEGGSWIMTERNYLEHYVGKEFIGRANGQFMTSSKKMDQALKETLGDARKLEEFFETKGWVGEKLYRMDIKNPLDYNPRLPHAASNGGSDSFARSGFTGGCTTEIDRGSVGKKLIDSNKNQSSICIMEEIFPYKLVEIAFEKREVDKLFLGVDPYVFMPRFFSTSLKTDIGYLLTEGLIPFYQRNPEIAGECFIVLDKLSKDYNGIPIVASFIFNLSYSMHVLGKNPLGIDIQYLAKSLQKSIALNETDLIKDTTSVGSGFAMGIFEDLKRLSKITTEIGGPNFFPEDNQQDEGVRL